MSNYIYSEKVPSAKSYIKLRKSVGWDNLSESDSEKSLASSLYTVSIFTDDSELIGFGRVVGDGVMYFYIQDVIVAEEYQGKGIAQLIMERIEGYLLAEAKSNATVGLFAAKGKEGFYQRFNYRVRDGEELGLGMCRFVE